MTTTEILEKITAIFKDIFDLENITINESTTALDVEEWDSLTHIQLIVAIEKAFKIKFTSSEISGFKNVGDLCNAVTRKLA